MLLVKIDNSGTITYTLSKETKFYAFACGSCESFKEDPDVIWGIEAHRKGKQREIGYLMGKQVEVYVEKGKVETSSSSTSCPPCIADTLTDGSLDALHKRWTDNPIRDIEGNILVDVDKMIKTYLKFEKKLSGD